MSIKATSQLDPKEWLFQGTNQAAAMPFIDLHKDLLKLSFARSVRDVVAMSAIPFGEWERIRN